MTNFFCNTCLFVRTANMNTSLSANRHGASRPEDSGMIPGRLMEERNVMYNNFLDSTDQVDQVAAIWLTLQPPCTLAVIPQHYSFSCCCSVRKAIHIACIQGTATVLLRPFARRIWTLTGILDPGCFGVFSEQDSVPRSCLRKGMFWSKRNTSWFIGQEKSRVFYIIIESLTSVDPSLGHHF
jgi:hypothetical protein